MVPEQGRLAAHLVASKQDSILHTRLRLGKGFSGTADKLFTLADITPCDFDGYAQISDPAWDAPAINGSDQAQGKSALLTWTAGAAIVSQTIVIIYMVWELNSAGEKLFWFKKLSPTVTLAVEDEVFQRYVDLFADDIAALD